MNERIVTTADTAASTIAPRTPALHVPITSSITKITEEIGALKAAARPAAAPMGAINRTFSCDKLSRRPSSEAIPAPICSEGSSGPSDWPVPMAEGAHHEFADDSVEWNVSIRDVNCRLRLIHAAAACAGKNVNHKERNDEAADALEQSERGAVAETSMNRKKAGAPIQWPFESRPRPPRKKFQSKQRGTKTADPRATKKCG